MHEYLLCVIIGAVLGWIVGWMVRGDENRRYHARRSMAGMALDPLPPARVVAWIPRGEVAPHQVPRAGQRTQAVHHPSLPAEVAQMDLGGPVTASNTTL